MSDASAVTSEIHADEVGQLLFGFVTCECPQSCDCEKPPVGDPKQDEVMLISLLCSEHNWNPLPDEHCMLHGPRYDV